MRWKNWKLLQGVSGGPEAKDDKPDGPWQPARGGDTSDEYRLFNLDEDPGERNDVSRDHPVIVQILQAKLQE